MVTNASPAILFASRDSHEVPQRDRGHKLPIGEEKAVIARDHCFPTIKCACRAGLVRGSVFNVGGRAADGLTHQTNDPISGEFWCSMKERPPWVAKPFPIQTQRPCPWKV